MENFYPHETQPLCAMHAYSNNLFNKNVNPLMYNFYLIIRK